MNIAGTINGVVTWKVAEEPHVQPVPILTEGQYVCCGPDFMVPDPRYTPDNKPYTSRTTGTRYTVPMAHKLDGGDSQPMDYEWSKFWRDCLGLYVPAHFKTSPFDPNAGEGNWEWLGDFVPASLLDQWFLHLIHGARALTNKTGPNNAGYYDPLTGFGTPGTSGEMKPYGKEPVTFGNNYCLQSEGRRIWALDGFERPPAVELVKDRFYLLHAFTQSAPKVLDKTPRPGCPNGVWPIPGAPQAGGNVVAHPIISRWEAGRVMTKDGIKLREINIPAERFLSYFPLPEYVPWPFVPQRDLIVAW